MSEDLVPLTSISLPTLVNQKLEALNLDLEGADLKVIRELLSVVQEERVLSQEEVQEWRKSEREILVNQGNYKNDTERIVKKAKCSFWFCLFFTLPICFCMYKAESKCYLKLFFRWPIHFIAILIHFFHMYISTHRIPEAVQAEELENVKDDWKDSMISTELHSRQKTLLNEWSRIVQERNKNPRLVPMIAYSINFLYFVLRSSVVWDILCKEENVSLMFLLSYQSAGLCFVEFCFTVLFVNIFFDQLYEFFKKTKSRKVVYVDSVSSELIP